MATFEVEGGAPLHGEITPQGAKNEALQILCATLLTPEKVTVRNVPAIVDVLQLIELLEKMGVKVGHPAEDTYTFEAREIDFGYLQSEDYRKRAARLRGSVMIIGPLLARFGEGYIPKPGGDKIGRPVSIPILSDSRNWAHGSTSIREPVFTALRANPCAVAICFSTRRP